MKTVQVLLSSPEGKWHGTACIHPRLPSPASLQSPPPKMTCSLTPSVSGSCSLPNHIPDITIQSESKRGQGTHRQYANRLDNQCFRPCSCTVYWYSCSQRAQTSCGRCVCLFLMDELDDILLYFSFLYTGGKAAVFINCLKNSNLIKTNPPGPFKSWWVKIGISRWSFISRLLWISPVHSGISNGSGHLNVCTWCASREEWADSVLCSLLMSTD